MNDVTAVRPWSPCSITPSASSKRIELFGVVIIVTGIA